MNKKAHEIGATSSTFTDASGLHFIGSATTACDMLQILIHAAGIPQIAEKWNKDRYEMKVLGRNARTELLLTSVTSCEYDESKWPIIGGKTGTITVKGSVSYNLAWITTVGDTEIACVLMGDTTDVHRWQDAEMINRYLEETSNGELKELHIHAPQCAVTRLPAHPIMYDNYTFALLASRSPLSEGIPASLTKLMTLITAYDYISDENEMVRIISSDLIGGSGSNLKAGDIVSIRDLVYDMLLPSSNCAAKALARHIGNKILIARKNGI